MQTTVLQLIEHLQKLDPNMVIKHRDTAIPMILHDIDLTKIKIEEFIDLGNQTASEAIRSGNFQSQSVVAVG